MFMHVVPIAVYSLLALNNKHPNIIGRRKEKTCILNAATKGNAAIDIPATIDAAELSKKYAVLLDWLKGQEDAFVSEKIEVKPSTLQGGGYGAFVTDFVEENEVLFRVPRKACITLSDAYDDTQFGEIFQALSKKAGPGGNTVVLAGFIAKEKLTSLDQVGENIVKNSRYGAYLATLPWKRGINNQEHILYWTDDEVESLLTDTMCYSEALDLRREVTLAATVLRSIFTRPARAFKFPWDTGNDDNVEIPLENLSDAVKAAVVCLLTRAFQDDIAGDDQNDEEKLVPLLDMLQHSEEPNVSHMMLRDKGGDVEVRSRRSLAAGEELLNQYRSEREENMPYHRVSNYCWKSCLCSVLLTEFLANETVCLFAKFFTRFGFVPGIEEPILDLLRDKSSIFVAQKAEV
jgi:SET domain